MKKLTLMLAATALSLMSARAQEAFNPGPYLQLQGGVAYDYGEALPCKLLSPTAQLGLGYQFTPAFSTRLILTGWQGKNYSVSESLYKYQFVQPGLDFKFDLGNLFNGWSPTRVVNPFWFFGGGVAVGLDNKDAIDLAANNEKFSLLWEPTKVFWAVRSGIGVDFRISDRVFFNLEVNANMFPDTFNSKKAVNRSESPDFRYNALAGFTFRFGKKARKAAPATAPVQYTPAPARGGKTVPVEPVAQEEPAQEEGPAIYQGADVDIFFDLNKAVIRDSEIATMNRLVSFLRNNPGARVQLDGYADRATGNAEINQTLSEQRAAAVRQYLISRGIASSRISVDAHGDTVQPFSGERNRAVTCKIR